MSLFRVDQNYDLTSLYTGDIGRPIYIILLTVGVFVLVSFVSVTTYPAENFLPGIMSSDCSVLSR